MTATDQTDQTDQQQPQLRQHPAMAAVQQKRAESVQLRVADAITTFAGSMMFVYIHAVIFGVWCATGLFGLDKFPYNFLTMSVSLEAIFLATFVMIGQNRQADFAQRKADHDFLEQEMELKVNTQLTRAIHALATDIHARLAEQLSDEAQAAITRAKEGGATAT